MFKSISQKEKAIIYIIFSAFCFTLTNIFVRISGDIPVMQKSFFRNLVAFIVAFLIVKREKIPYFANKESMPPLIIRSAVGTIGIMCCFYAVDNLMLSDATILNMLSPFFVIIFSAFILKEKIKLIQLLGVVAAFIGVLFVVKPTMGLTQELFSSLVGLLGALTTGLAYIMVRICNQKGAKGPQIVLFFSGFSSICVLPYIVFNYCHMSISQVICLIMAGVCAAGGQFFVTAAYSNAPAKEISMYDYSQLIFSAILGFIIFGNIPDLYSVIGYIIIFASSFAMFIYNNRK